jgi:hypothetical protein
VVNAALSAIWAGILIALQRGSKQSRLQQS